MIEFNFQLSKQLEHSILPLTKEHRDHPHRLVHAHLHVHIAIVRHRITLIFVPLIHPPTIRLLWDLQRLKKPWNGSIQKFQYYHRRRQTLELHRRRLDNPTKSTINWDKTIKLIKEIK